MKKAKLYFAFLLIIALMAVALFACNEVLPAGTDTDSDTDKGGSSGLPQLSFLTDEYGIEISFEGEYSFYVKMDDEEETIVLPGYPFDFSDEVGDHVISAYATDASGNKVAEGIFRYKTVEVVLSDLTAYGLEVTWTAAARTVSVKERGSYAPVSGDIYVAEQEGAVVSVKAEGGFDVENAVYYVGDDVVKSVKVITGLDKPQLSVSGRSVTWQDVRNAAGYMVSYDGGAFSSALSATISETIGAHKIEVKALGNGVTYSDSRAVLEYETLAGELQVSKVASDTVVLFADSMSFSSSANGRDFSLMSGSQYVASKTGKTYFRANAGFIAEDNKYYLAGNATEVDLMIASQTDAPLDAGTNPSSWVCSDGLSVTAALTYDGTRALSLNAFNNNVLHTFSTQYSLTDAYDGISFLYRGDGISSLTLSLVKQGSEFTLTRSLGVMPDHWVKVAIPFEDEGWMWKEGNISLRTLWEKKSSNSEADRVTGVPRRVMAAHSTTELAAFFDTLTLSVRGNAPAGAATSLVLADLFFLAEGEHVLSMEQPLYDIGTTYVAYEEMGESQTNELILELKAQDEFSIYSTALEENFSVTGSAHIYEDQATLILEDIESGFTMELAFVQNGRALVVRSASGKNASHFPVDRLFEKAADLALDFETEAAVSDGWSAYAYSFTDGGWTVLDELPLSASSRNLSGNLCFRTGKNLIYKIVYNEVGEKIGLTNYISVKFGNYNVGADSILLKLVATDVYGTSYYLEGGEGMGAYRTVDPANVFAVYEYPIPAMILRSLAVIVEYRGANDHADLYIDDLSAEYVINPALFSDYPAPDIEVGEHALTFSYDERATIEYSVNGSAWAVYDGPYAIPESNGTYTVRARAILEANGAVTQEASYTFTVERVYVNSVKIEIVEVGTSQRVRWNTNSNIVSLRVDEKVDDHYIAGEYEPYTEDNYVSETNAAVHIRAEGYFDRENKKYYVGTVEVEKKIIVQANLGTPNIVATEVGLTWEEVEDANAYAVSINGGDEVIRSERSLSYAISEGNYVVRIRAVTLVEKGEGEPAEEGEVIGYGDESEFVYSVKNVKFTKHPSVDKDTLNWTALACKVYVKDNDGDYVENDSGRYTAEVIGAHRIYVKAVPGYSFDENVYYYAENDLISEEMIIVVANMKTPTLLLHEGANGVYGLYWAYLNDRDEIVNTVADMRGTHDFLTYSISINNGEWTLLDEDVYFFEPLAEGVYSVRIRANGNGANYRDSKASAAYSFTIKHISLTGINVDSVDGVITATYDFVSLVTKRKIGPNGAFAPTDEKVYTPSATTWLTVRVEGGWDEANKTYYAGNYIESDAVQIIVPIKLVAPVITLTADRIEWTKVDYATGYRITVNGGEPIIQSAQTLEYLKADGDFAVTVVAVNGNNPAQYPDSEVATVTYHRSAADVIYQKAKTSVTWTYTGKLYRSFNDQYHWEECYDNEYVNKSGDQIVLYLKAEAETVITEQGDEAFIYYALPQEQKVKEISFIAFTLVAPELKQEGMVLSWEANDKANCFKYTTLDLSASDEEIAEAEADLDSWTVVEKSDPHYIVFDQETYGDKLFLIKAIGNGDNISDSVTVIRGLRAVSLSDINVTEGVASWKKCGITKMQTSNNPDSGYSEAEDYRVTTYAPNKTTWIILVCRGGYDSLDNVYYFGDTIITPEAIKITVPRVLAKPVIEMQNMSIFIGTVDNADKYIYTVNGGEEVTINKNQIKTIDYASSVGVYTVTVFVRSNDPEQYPDSQPATITYEVKQVSLADFTADNVNGRAEFTSVGLLTVEDPTDGRLESLPNDSFHYYPKETTSITVTASPGVDVANKIKYIGAEESEKDKTIIVPIPLATPTIVKGEDNIVLGDVTFATGYRVKVDNGGWQDQTATEVAYASSSGAHTVYVKSYADNSTQYPDSEVVSVTFTTEQLSLSDQLAVSGATVSWNANAAYVKIKIDKADYTRIEASSYTVTKEGTTNITVRAYIGYSSANDIYYNYSSSHKQTASCSVSIKKLATPTLSVSGNKITWSAVTDASGYEVKVGSGNYITQSSTEKALSTQEGKYKVYVRAKGNGTTVLSGEAALLEYTTKTVTLSDISVSGSTATWSSVANKTSISVNGGSYAQTTATSYTPSSQGTFALKLKAEGGWNNSSKIYYYASKAIEKSATVKLYKLSTPSLTTSDRGITWGAVSDATSYSVKIDSGNYKSQTDCSVTFSTVTGEHTISVKAVGVASSGYQDSDVVTFNYATKQTSLTFLTSTTTMATWVCTGVKAQYSENGSTYKDAKYSGYTATKSGDVYFKAIGGYDASAKVFYNGTTAATKKTFTLPGMCINNNFENGASGWTKEVFNGNTNAWDTTTATAVTSVADGYGAGSAICFKSYLNGMAYRFGYNFGDLPTEYKSLSFDVKLNEYSATGTSLRFQDSVSKTYVDYSFNNISLDPGAWYHITLHFEDGNLIVNSGNKEYSAPKAKSLLGESNYYDKIKALDQMYITVKGSVGSGPAAYTCIDNFVFSKTTATTNKTKITAVVMGFNDGTVGQNYTASGWKAYKYGNSDFEENPNVLKIEDGAKVLSLYCGGTTSKVTYNVGGSSLGEFNHFQMDVGTEASKVSYSIELVTEDGESIYVAGGDSYRATMNGTGGVSGMKTIVFNFTKKKIKSIIVYASESTGNGHFYMDNIFLSKLS